MGDTQGQITDGHATQSTGRGARRARRTAIGLALACAIAGAAAPGAGAQAPPGLFWVTDNALGAANLDGSGMDLSLITAVSEPSGIAIDGAGRHLYWSNDLGAGGSIGEADLDGTVINAALVPGLSDPGPVAVAGSHLYWGSPVGTGTIAMANLDGSGPATIIGGVGSPGGLAADGQHLYWTDFKDGLIGEANLDGTDPELSLISGLTEPSGIAVDGQHLYWTNLAAGTIGEATLDGTVINPALISGLNEPDGLAVGDGHLYWANIGDETIGQANLDGTGVVSSLTPVIQNLEGIAAFAQAGASVSPSAPAAFPATTQGQLSAPRTLTISNTGDVALTLSGLTVIGADPGDFAVTSDGCLGALAGGATCPVTVSFTPQAPGARTATLQIASNDPASPLTVALSGTGGAPVQSQSGQTGATGPRGATGATGPAGPKGATGSQGPAGTISCRKTLLAQILCSLEFTPGTWKKPQINVTAAYRIVHDGRTVRHGTLTVRRGRVTSRRISGLRRGRYTLIIAAGTAPGAKVLLTRTFRVR